MTWNVPHVDGDVAHRRYAAAAVGSGVTVGRARCVRLGAFYRFDAESKRSSSPGANTHGVRGLAASLASAARVVTST
jgi:hypothetical protein